MVKDGFIINVTESKIERLCSYDDKIVDSMFVKVDGKDLIPAAYVYPTQSRAEVEHLLLTLKEAKLRYDKIVSEIYYQRLPKLRCIIISSSIEW